MAPTEFRWIEWNREHATKHGCTIAEIESVARNAGHGFPRKADKSKWTVTGRGVGDRLIEVVYLLDDDGRSLCYTRDAADNAPQTRLIGTAMAKHKQSDIEDFIALPDAEKERIFQELEDESPEDRLARSRPLNARERRQWRKFQARSKMGRPKVGKGAKTISLTVEMGLLKQADAYAKRHGISRAKVVAEGLAALFGSAA